MITVYIKGRGGFKKAILDKMKYSWLNGNSEIVHEVIMFWLTDYDQLRNFKTSIGSKMIFKYRLQFFTNLEEYLQTEKDKVYGGFSPTEKKLIFDMTSWESDQRVSRMKVQASL